MRSSVYAQRIPKRVVAYNHGPFFRLFSPAAGCEVLYVFSVGSGGAFASARSGVH